MTLTLLITMSNDVETSVVQCFVHRWGRRSHDRSDAIQWTFLSPFNTLSLTEMERRRIVRGWTVCWWKDRRFYSTEKPKIHCGCIVNGPIEWNNPTIQMLLRGKIHMWLRGKTMSDGWTLASLCQDIQILNWPTDWPTVNHILKSISHLENDRQTYSVELCLTSLQGR